MAGPSKTLETFPNPSADRDYEIAFDVPEFTCLCPLTGQPDFAHFRIRYVPDQKCVELKSLKLYFWSYRNEGAFHEAVTNRIRDDLVAALAPRSLILRSVSRARRSASCSIRLAASRVRSRTSLGWEWDSRFSYPARSTLAAW